MTKQVNWNEDIYYWFRKLAMLSDLESEILRTRIMGMSIVEQSMHFGLSVRSVNRIVSALKDKYDQVQPLSDGHLPKRRVSYQEEWMDAN